jgi:polysaccharide chain length determinant protein (PEP-CTERM system associated)
MQAFYQQLIDTLRGIWHRRWIGLAVAWLVGIAAVAVVYRIPQKFEARARVYVDTESLLRPLLAGLAIQPNLDQQVALISRTLISRPNVEKLARMADLDLAATSPADRDELIDTIIKQIRLEGGGSSNLYTISYRDVDPNQSKRVVQSLLTIFVESSLGNKRQDTQTAVKFLDDQIKNYEKTLEAAENRIKDFKLKYMGVAVNSQGQDYFGRVQKLASALEDARMELQSAEQTRDSYKKQLAGEEPIFLSSPGQDRTGRESVSVVDTRVEALRKELDTLLRKYTEQHPDVVATERLIKQLEEQRKTEIELRQKAAAGGKAQAGVEQNPVYQQMKISLADAEAAVASARAKFSSLENQQRSLKAQAQLVPQIEAEFVQLNRDYDIQKKTYESLLSRRESATMGKDVQDTSGAQFRVIDPPRVSAQPVSPNRLALLALAFAVSLGAGVFASFAASQLMPTFHEARTLRAVTKRPIVGMVSMLPNEKLQRARRRYAWLFAGGVSSLVAAFGAIFAMALLFGRAA